MQPPAMPSSSATPASAPKRSGLALTSLVLGILSVACLGSCVTGVPAILLGIIGLVKINKSRGTLSGSGLAIGGICAGAIGTLFISGITAALIIPAFAGARDRATQAACVNNTRQLTLLCLQYAAQNDDTLPKSMDAMKQLVGEPGSKMFFCRAALDQSEPSYELVAGGQKTTGKDPSQTIIIREKAGNHHGKSAVGFLDGSARMMSDEELNNLPKPTSSAAPAPPETPVASAPTTPETAPAPAKPRLPNSSWSQTPDYLVPQK